MRKGQNNFNSCLTENLIVDPELDRFAHSTKVYLMEASGILALICIGIALLMTWVFVAMKNKRHPAYMNASLGLSVTAGRLTLNPIKYTTVHKCTLLY